MKKLKNTCILIILLGIIQSANAEESERTYYLTTNLLSPLAGNIKGNAAANAILPLFSNLEYGITLSGGYFKDYYSVESRITIGQSNDYNIIPQIQFGYSFFIINYFKKNESKFYLGGNIRYWDYINRYTETQRHNVSPGIHAGYIWEYDRCILDIRIHQNFAIFTKTNIEHTEPGFDFCLSPMPELSQVLPFLSINIGYKF